MQSPLLISPVCIVVIAMVCTLAIAHPQVAKAQTGQPAVLATWSQIIGESSGSDGHLPAPPTVDFRFVVPSTVNCNVFRVKTRPSATSSNWTVAANRPTTRSETADQLQDIDVCAYSADGWYEAKLEYSDSTGNWSTATLTSQYPQGSTRSEVARRIMKGGASDGAEVIVKGPAWIGGARSAGASRSDLVMITLGDTGCRGKPEGQTSGRKVQACDSSSWPLAGMAADAATMNPDLVIHVGDYRYFLEDNVSTDSWLYWQKDFFPHAQPLLLAAPWIFSRGNHEMCQSISGWGFGEAWFQFFGTSTNNTCTDAMSPAYVDVAPQGAGNVPPHRFLMIDNSDDHSRKLEDNYEDAIAITHSSAPDSVWWVGHIPPLNLLYYGSVEHDGDGSVRNDLYDAMESTGMLCASGKCKPSTYLLGHQHLYQRLVFTDDNGQWLMPQHVIVGHGGVKVDVTPPVQAPFATCTYDRFPFFEKDGVQWKSVTISGTVTTETAFGFVKWTRDASSVNTPSGWKSELNWATGPSRKFDGKTTPCFD